MPLTYGKGGKDVARIRRGTGARMVELFVGLHTDPDKPDWHRCGHFIEGVTFKARRVVEKDGDLNERGNCGWIIEWSGEPAQNEWEDMKFYEEALNGKRNIAMVTGNILRIFRIRDLGGLKIQDNRISVVTDDGYERQDKAYTRMSGHVFTFERIKAADVTVSNGKLRYKQLSPMEPQSAPSDNGTPKA